MIEYWIYLLKKILPFFFAFCIFAILVDKCQKKIDQEERMKDKVYYLTESEMKALGLLRDLPQREYQKEPKNYKITDSYGKERKIEKIY